MLMSHINGKRRLPPSRVARSFTCSSTSSSPSVVEMLDKSKEYGIHGGTVVGSRKMSSGQRRALASLKMLCSRELPSINPLAVCFIRCILAEQEARDTSWDSVGHPAAGGIFSRVTYTATAVQFTPASRLASRFLLNLERLKLSIHRSVALLSMRWSTGSRALEYRRRRGGRAPLKNTRK